MNRKTSLRAVGGLFAVALGVALAGAAAASNAAPDVKIPFANHGGIRDWEADRDQGLWVQDAHRNWFYAKFMSPCIGLNFAQSIGFDTHPMGTFDRFSAIVVPGEGRCQVQSLRVSGAPAAKDTAAKDSSAKDQRS
jgi:hypothetical protein